MGLLIFCAPGTNGIAEVRALVVYLGVVTHAGLDAEVDGEG